MSAVTIISDHHHVMPTTMDKYTIVFKGLDYDLLCVILYKSKGGMYGDGHISQIIAKGMGLW